MQPSAIISLFTFTLTTMVGYVIIHKNEWARIKDQATFPDNTPVVNPQDELRKAQIKQSQKWIRSWPDSDAGLVIQANKRNKRLKAEQFAEMKEFAENLKIKYENVSKKALEKAKLALFTENGVGRELLSALYESKVIEERELQVKFNKQIKQKAQEHEKDIESNKLMYTRDDKEDLNRRKETAAELAKYNKESAQKQKELLAKFKECENKGAIEDARLTKQYLDMEKQFENNQERKDSWNKEIQEHEDYRNKLQEERQKREQLEDKSIEIWQNYKDVVRCKEKMMLDMIHKDRHNTESSIRHYNLVKKLQDDEIKSYEDFIEKGIKRQEKIAKLKQQKETEELNLNLASCKSIAEKCRNAIDANMKYSEGEAALDRSKCVCWRQSLFTKSEDQRRTSTVLPDKLPPSFMSQSNPLLKKLKERELEPSAFSGTISSQKYYAQQANNIYEECKHKGPPRKVIQSYCKRYFVDPKTIIPAENVLLDTKDEKAK